MALLKIKHLSKNLVLARFCKISILSSKKGEILAILGFGDYGKSTLLRCINRLEPTDRGNNIIFKDKIINAKGTNWQLVRQKIGMVFQDYEIFSHLSILENIILVPIKVEKHDKDYVINDAKSLLARFNLLDKKDAMPKSLSVGQRQRAAKLFVHCV